jgi:hypothetical protein
VGQFKERDDGDGDLLPGRPEGDVGKSIAGIPAFAFGGDKDA